MVGTLLSGAKVTVYIPGAHPSNPPRGRASEKMTYMYVSTKIDKFYGEYDAFFNSEWYDDDMR